VTAAAQAPTTIALRIRCADAAEAARLLRALAPDDPGSADLRAEGADLLVAARSASALGALRTVDDVLGCLRAAGPAL
jgi:hypothetical protein